jgi:hypothetical protein
MTSLVNSTIVALISSIAPLFIGHTPSMSASMPLLSKTNAFYFDMPSMGMLNVLNGSQPTSQYSNIGVGIYSIPYQLIPCGGDHIPPSFPSVRSGAFPSPSPNPFGGWGASTGVAIMPSN